MDPRPTVLVLALILTVVPATTVTVSADPAPAITPEDPQLIWQGAHFEAGATPAPEACTPETCDAFTFRLDVPDGFWEEDQGLEVSIQWAIEQDDFELYLYDEDDELVATSSGSFSTAEGVFVPQASPGLYTAVIVPLTVDDASYEGLAELELSTDPTDGPLLPNLVSKPPHDLRIVAPVGYGTGTPLEVGGQRPISCNADETVEEQVTRCLRFSNTVVNDGDGNLEARFLTEGAAQGMIDEEQQRLVQRIYHGDGSYHDRLAGHYEFHEVHGHVHYEGFAQHWLYHADDGTLAREGAKNGFCMEDVAHASWAQQGNGPRTYSFPACNLPTDQDGDGSWMVQGISKGWADIYTWDLPDQYIDITGLPDGCYLLVTEVDPGGTFVEKTREDNTASVMVEIKGTTATSGPC